jgi:hypothetical protein
MTGLFDLSPAAGRATYGDGSSGITRFGDLLNVGSVKKSS